MKILVTGGSGFLGSAVIRHLLAGGYSVRVLLHRKSNRDLFNNRNTDIIEGDVTQPQTVDKAVLGCEVVMHLAALYMFYPWWEKKAAALYKINVEGTRSVCAAALKHKVQRFIFTSSIASIGKAPKGRLSNEETPFNLSDDYSHYAKSKFLAEYEVMKFCARGLPALILNPAIIIGEGDYKPTPSGEIIVKFLNRIYPCYFEAALAIADLDDVVKAHISAIKRGRIGQKYILCDKETYSLKRIFEILEEISGVKAPRIKLPYPLLSSFACVDEILSYFILKKRPLLPIEGLRFCKMSIKFDNRKAVEELGYTTTPIRETLAKAVNWYRENGYIKNVSV